MTLPLPHNQIDDPERGEKFSEIVGRIQENLDAISLALPATPIGLTTRSNHIDDSATDFTGGDTVDKALLDNLAVKVNTILDVLEAHGLMEP